MPSDSASSTPLAAGGRSGGASLGVRAAVFVLFFSSGMAGLVYEVVWSRMLTYRFGATLDAVTAILVSFMGGLALGAWLLGKTADRSRRPLALYGGLEILIGLSALLLPLALELVAPLYRAIVAATQDSFLSRRLLRFGLSILLLLVPTTAMGATLPALSRFLTRGGKRLGLNVGGLYGVNTFGAVAGCALSGFLFIATFGVRNTLWLAAALNILAGVCALALSKSLREEEMVDAPEESPALAGADLAAAPSAAPTSSKLILAIYGVSGFVALALQVAWFRSLVFNFEFLKNTTYAFSAMLTVFLVGVALGSMVMTPFADKLERPRRAFALLEMAIGLGGCLSFLAIYHNFPDTGAVFIDEKGGVSWGGVVATLFAQTGSAIFLPTFCMGLLFPVAARCCVASGGHVGAEVGRLYAYNTVGAIFGAFASNFLIVPTLGVGWAILVLSGVALGLGALAMWKAGEASSPTERAAFALAPPVLAAVFVLPALPKQHPIEMQRILLEEKMVYYADGPLGTISVVEDQKGSRTIYVDNVGVAGTDPILLTDQKSLAHVPMLFVPEPKKVLTVGFGSGGASYSYTTYPELEEIHCVEIDPTVPRAASTLAASNWAVLAPKHAFPGGGEGVVMADRVRARLQREERKHEKAIPVVWDWLPAEVDHREPLDEFMRKVGAGQPTRFEEPRAPHDAKLLGYFASDERYRIILDDARELLQSTETKYDVIATDCTDLRYKTNANLYDIQYFEACRNRLTDDGLVVVWMPMGGLSGDMFQVALRTFAKVFPKMAVWYMNNEPTHYCLLLGWKNELKIDLERMAARLAIPAVKEDLAELNLDSSEKILSCYLADAEGLADWLGEEGALNTEDRPVLEFEAPKFGYNDQPLIDNLDIVVKRRNDVMRYVTGTPEAVEAMRAALVSYEAAEPFVIQGHGEYRRIETAQALASYMKAFELCPDDKATKALLDFNEMKLMADRAGSPWHILQLGMLYEAQATRDPEALTYLNRVINFPPPAPDAPADAKRQIAQMRADALEASARIYDRNEQPDRAADLRKRAAAALADAK